MSTQVTLMQLPTEILDMILQVYYSAVHVGCCRMIRRSQRGTSMPPKRYKPSFVSVMLANRTLHHLGMKAYLSSADFNCDYLFHGSPTHTKRVYAQTPWTQLRFISGGISFARILEERIAAGQIDIGRLEQIQVIDQIVYWSVRHVFSEINTLSDRCRLNGVRLEAQIEMDTRNIGQLPVDSSAPARLHFIYKSDADETVRLHKIVNMNREHYATTRRFMSRHIRFELPDFDPYLCETLI